MKTAPLVIILLIGLGILGYIFLNKQNETDNLNINDDLSSFEEENNTGTQTNTNAQTPSVTPPPTNPTPTNPPVTPPAVPTTSPSNPPAQNGGQPSQSEIETFVSQEFSDCSEGDCSSVTISFEQDVGNQYLVTAVYVELDDSVASTKKQWLVLYNNGVISLAPTQPNPDTERTCHRGNSDGSTGWTTGNCI